MREALGTPGVVLALLATGAAADRHADLVATARRAGAAVHLVGESELAGVTQTVTPQGLVAVCRFVDVPLERLAAAGPRLVVLLAQVRDPGNAGTVLRTADAAGADGVVFAAGSVDPYNGKCVRASAGSLFHLDLVAGPPAADAVATLRAAGLQVLAADGTGPEDLDELVDRGALRAPSCWLFGNEAWGLPADLHALADRVVRVPIHGRAESLNLAAAAAVCLYATARAQRRGPAGTGVAGTRLPE